MAPELPILTYLASWPAWPELMRMMTTLEAAVRLAVGVAVVEAGPVAVHRTQQPHAAAPPGARAPRVLPHAVQARAVARPVPPPLRPPPAARRRRSTAIVSLPLCPSPTAATSTTSTAAASTTTTTTSAASFPATPTSAPTALGAPPPSPAVAPRGSSAATPSTPTSTASILPGGDTTGIVTAIASITLYTLHLSRRPDCSRREKHTRAAHGRHALSAHPP
ncbi:hypothetical protein SETIT_4G141300v2 [Setaria italica]|uniref:Uncharacterized protein n=1 Tax=Setaria italica TaxID=4555 RepID=A0A368QU68_SETIT|nr:hypothetical protein SETIT_4G141300v2 [Setaria italica]